MDFNSPLFYALAAIVILCLVPLLNLYLYRVYTALERLGNTAEDGEEISQEPLSVIITSHNMGGYLRENLPLVLEQDYSRFEVIVVNDASTDDTEDILKLLEQKYDNLYHTFTPETAKYLSHKKLALTLGIRAAKYEWLVFTEANCRPAGNGWLRSLARNFTADTNIVIGYTNYPVDEDCPRFSRKVIFDRLYHQMYELYQAARFRAIKATGCNLAYRKSFFTANKGFSNHLDLLRGSNELFVNNYAQYKEGTRVELSPESFVWQSLPDPHRLWGEDKVFYMETRRHYLHKFNAHAIFNWDTFTNYVAWVAFPAGMAFTWFFPPVPALPYAQWIFPAFFFLVFVAWSILKVCLFRKTTNYLQAPHYSLSLLWYELWIPVRNLTFRLKHNAMDRRNFMRR